ncbi:MAG: hypothetical protein HY897_05210 [Deltaproteobacteria bacterium]|nr:hypothetical protein [Deltaproteobacteria bacterium]
MIAQEVEKIFPEWVGADKDGFKDLTFRGFEALTVEAMRELKAENDALKERLAALERAVAMKGVGGTGDVGTVAEERRRGATQTAAKAPASAPATSREASVRGFPSASWAWLIALFGVGFVAWGRGKRQG